MMNSMLYTWKEFWCFFFFLVQTLFRFAIFLSYRIERKNVKDLLQRNKSLLHVKNIITFSYFYFFYYYFIYFILVCKKFICLKLTVIGVVIVDVVVDALPCCRFDGNTICPAATTFNAILTLFPFCFCFYSFIYFICFIRVLYLNSLWIDTCNPSQIFIHVHTDSIR